MNLLLFKVGYLGDFSDLLCCLLYNDIFDRKTVSLLQKFHVCCFCQLVDTLYLLIYKVPITLPCGTPHLMESFVYLYSKLLRYDSCNLVKITGRCHLIWNNANICQRLCWCLGALKYFCIQLLILYIHYKIQWCFRNQNWYYEINFFGTGINFRPFNHELFPELSNNRK